MTGAIAVNALSAGLRLDRVVELELAVLDAVDAVVAQRRVAVVVDRVGAEHALAVGRLEQGGDDVGLGRCPGARSRRARGASPRSRRSRMGSGSLSYFSRKASKNSWPSGGYWSGDSVATVSLQLGGDVGRDLALGVDEAGLGVALSGP